MTTTPSIVIRRPDREVVYVSQSREQAERLASLMSQPGYRYRVTDGKPGLRLGLRNRGRSYPQKAARNDTALFTQAGDAA